MPIFSDHKTTEQITDEEFTTLRQLLKLIRDERQWVTDFISSLSYLAKQDEKLDAAHVGGQLLQAWQNDPLNKDSHPGVVHCIGEAAGYQEISEDEFQELRNYLAVVRADGWLANHMSIECRLFGEGKRYTPAEVIQHLVGHEADTFDAEIAISKERLRDYPRLFQDDLAALQKAKAHERSATPAKPPKKATRPAKRSAVA